MRTFIRVFMLITFLAAAGCKSNGSVDSNGMPKTLVMAW